MTLEQVEDAISEVRKGHPDVSGADLWKAAIGALPADEAEQIWEDYSNREIATAVADHPNTTGKQHELTGKLLDAREVHTRCIAAAKAADEHHKRLQTVMQRANARAATGFSKLSEALRAEVSRQVQVIADSPKDRDFAISDYKELNKLKAERASLTTTISGIAELLMPEAAKRAEESQIEEMTAEGAVFTAIADLLDFMTAEQMQGAHLLQSRIVIDTSSGRSGAFRRKASNLLVAADSRRNNRSILQVTEGGKR